MWQGLLVARLLACETIRDLILRSALLSLSKDARVSKDGHGLGRASGHPSRRALKGAPQDEVWKYFTASFADDDTGA